MRQYIQNPSALLDAEYNITFHDNGTSDRLSVPGPSDYEIILALKMEPDSVSNWLDGTTPTDVETALTPWESLQLDTNDWKMEDTPRHHRSANGQKTIVEYRESGIVLARFATY